MRAPGDPGNEGTTVVTAKRQRKKDAIMETAARLFAERGFERVSFLDIGRELNLGRTTIYDYFENKGRLLALYLEKEMGRYRGKAMAAIRQGEDLHDKLKAFIELQLDYAVRHDRFRRLHAELGRSHFEAAAATTSSLLKRHHEIYSELAKELNTAIRKKEIKDIPVDLVVQLLVNATSLPVNVRTNLAATTEDVLSVFMSGISKRVR